MSWSLLYNLDIFFWNWWSKEELKISIFVLFRLKLDQIELIKQIALNYKTSSLKLAQNSIFLNSWNILK